MSGNVRSNDVIDSIGSIRDRNHDPVRVGITPVNVPDNHMNIPERE